MAITFSIDQYEQLLKSLQSIRSLHIVGKMPTTKIDNLIKKLNNQLVLQLSSHDQQEHPMEDDAEAR